VFRLFVHTLREHVEQFIHPLNFPVSFEIDRSGKVMLLIHLKSDASESVAFHLTGNSRADLFAKLSLESMERKLDPNPLSSSTFLSRSSNTPTFQSKLFGRIKGPFGQSGTPPEIVFIKKRIRKNKSKHAATRYYFPLSRALSESSNQFSFGRRTLQSSLSSSLDSVNMIHSPVEVPNETDLSSIWESLVIAENVFTCSRLFKSSSFSFQRTRSITSDFERGNYLSKLFQLSNALIPLNASPLLSKDEQGCVSREILVPLSSESFRNTSALDALIKCRSPELLAGFEGGVRRFPFQV